jgi:hypothetical protein
LSSKLSEISSISFNDRIFRNRSVSGLKTFPFAGVIFSSGSNAPNISSTNPLNPLKTDKEQTVAMVATAMPQTATKEIILTALCDFLEKRYRFAM